MTITDKRNATKERGISFVANIKGSVYILGTNKYGENVKNWLLINNFFIAGFINDFTALTSFSDFPVIRSIDVPAGQFIVNAIVEGRAIDAQNTIVRLMPSQFIDYFSLQLAYPFELHEIDFLENTDDIISTLVDYQNLHKILEDDESKNTLINLTNFRLNRNIDLLCSFKFRLEEQYFEPFIELGAHPVFIDGGGFDGTTSLFFAKKYPDYESIHFFEPTREAYEAAKNNLKNLGNIKYYSKGLWDCATELRFDDTSTSANKVTNAGNTVINTTTLDDTIKSKVDYLKLDIEGAEYKALLGAKNLIKRYKPNLAVCVYHNQKDFIEIPNLILSFNPDYKIYLRHYTQGVFETVMYFI